MWPWVLAGLLLFVLALVGLALWLVPPWLERVATESLTQRLERKLEQPVRLGRVEVELPRVRLHGLTIGDPHLPLVYIDAIDVELDEDALWSGRAEPIEVTVRGGAVRGPRDEIVAVARKLLGRGEREPRRPRGRIRLIPRQLHVHDLRIDVHEGDPRAPSRHVEGMLTLDATPARGQLGVALTDLRVQDEGMPSVRATAVRADLQLLRTPEGRRLRFPLDVAVEGVGAQLTPQIAVAGVEGRVTISDAALSELAVDLEGGLSDRDDGRARARLWSVAGRLRRDLSEGELRVAMDAFVLGKVPEVLARLPVVESDDATVGGRVAVAFGEGLVRAEGQVRLDGLNVAHRTLAREIVRDVGFDLDFAVELDPEKPRISIHHASVRRRGVELRLAGELEHPAERNDRRYRLHAEVSPTPCQQVLEAIPVALVPSMPGFALGGTFDLSLDVDVDFADLDALRLEGGVGLWGCRVEQRPPRAAVERLAGGFTHRVTMRDGQIRSVHLYPGSGSFTPLPQISPHMVQAVLTTEDGGFFRHRGFLPSQFRTALRRNLEAGRIQLGASTITMQMVKNVLLSHERTLARKLQEMILTWYVETVLSKARIMEIYLNIVELGPGIYGVTRAAEHYFGKHPADLTPPEAVYLALMLPSPVRRHAHYCRGELTSSFQVKMERILRIMHERGRLPDLDYEIYRSGEIQFDPLERGDPEACLGQIAALMEADQGQRALTGLLATPGDLDLRPEVDDDLAAVHDVDPAGLVGTDAGPPPVWDPANADAPGVPAMDDELPSLDDLPE